MKLSHEERELLSDNRELVALVHRLASSFLDRHVERLLTESIDDGDGTKLLLCRARLDGMKQLLSELSQYATAAKATKNPRA